MKKKITHIEENRKAFDIEIPAKDVKTRKDELFNKIGKTAAVPGFRMGKAPRDLLEKHYGDRVLKEVIEDLISDSYQKAINEEGFIPLGLPDISDIKLDDSSSLSFKAEFNIRPRIELKDYKALKITKKSVEIKEKDVRESVEALRESSAKFKNAENRPVRLGDYIVCDSEILVEGKPISKKRENIWMPIEEKSYIPNLSAALMGANLNDEKEIESTIPADFSNKEYADKKAIFKIKVKEIKEKILPQIDDEFAKDLGYNNLSALEESVRKMLERQAELKTRHEMEHQVIERLLENANFTVPTSLVEEQLKYLIAEEKERLIKQGLKEPDIEAKEKELEARLRPVSEKQVKTMFILDEIAHKEKISVSSEELDETLEEIAKRHNQGKAKIEKYYKDNDLLSNLKMELRNGKILDLLIKQANIVVS
ncbi:MAG: trigger factor [Candidatus Omnitrophica bacterium]|nr:trigger factor [Candidatus Omnitrophota bacterium]